MQTTSNLNLMSKLKPLPHRRAFLIWVFISWQSNSWLIRRLNGLIRLFAAERLQLRMQLLIFSKLQNFQQLWSPQGFWPVGPSNKENNASTYEWGCAYTVSCLRYLRCHRYLRFSSSCTVCSIWLNMVSHMKPGSTSAKLPWARACKTRENLGSTAALQGY